jgi:hypothetical protein
MNIKQLDQKKITGEIEKNTLEIKKLNNELYLQNNPLKNPANWASFVTLIASLFAIIWAICTGWFQDQKESISLEVGKNGLKLERLRFEVEQFQIKRDNLSVLIARKNESLENKTDSLIQLDSAYNTIKKEYAAAIRIIDTPQISIVADFSPTDVAPGIILTNTGNGPVFLDEFIVCTKDQTLNINSEQNGDRLLQILNINTDHFSYTWLGTNPRKVSLCQKIVLIGLNKSNFNASDNIMLKSINNQIGITIKYHGLSGRQQVYQKGGIVCQ